MRMCCVYWPGTAQIPRWENVFVVKHIRLVIPAGLVMALPFTQVVAVSQQNGAQDQTYVLFGKKPPKQQAATTRMVRGRVTDKDGKPVTGAIVEARAPGGTPESAATDDGGIFTIDGLKLTSDYEVKARKEGLLAATRKLSQYDSRKEVYLNFLLKPDKQHPAAAKKDEK